MKHNPQQEFVQIECSPEAEKVWHEGKTVYVLCKDGKKRIVSTYSSQRRASKEAIQWQKQANIMAYYAKLNKETNH